MKTVAHSAKNRASSARQARSESVAAEIEALRRMIHFVRDGRSAALRLAFSAAMTRAIGDGEGRDDAAQDVVETLATLQQSAAAIADAKILAGDGAEVDLKNDLAVFARAATQAEPLRRMLDDDSGDLSAIAEFGAFAGGELRVASDRAVEVIEAAIDRLSRQAQGDASEAKTLIDQTLSEVEEISLRVRLISLNASVEAARAGAAGRGFGVIASEIQNLAVRAQSSVDSVRTQIKDLSL